MIYSNLSLNNIIKKIHIIRGFHVMVDCDLAELYEIEVKNLNKAVRRNINKFPDDFVFKVIPEEYNLLKEQFENLYLDRGRHRKYLPFVFTEHGVAMLSSILKNDRAIQINIKVIRAFVESRKSLIGLSDLKMDISEIKNKLDILMKKTDNSSDHFLNLPHNKNTFKIQIINNAVAKFYDLKVEDLTKKTRIKSISIPRQVAIYIIRTQLGISFKEIGEFFLGKDHTTILYSYRKIESDFSKNGVISKNINDILLKINNEDLNKEISYS